MAQQQIRVRTKLWTPSTPLVDATDIVFPISRGERVVWASAELVSASTVGTVATVALGDGTSTAGYIAAITPTVAVQAEGTLIGGSGALLAASGGKLYDQPDTIDALWDYTSGGATAPKVRFTIGVVREFPV